MLGSRLSLSMRVGFLACAPLHVGACLFDARVDETAQLQCATNADCPDGWTCDDALARCLPVAPTDGDAPTLVEGSVEIAPARARLDAIVSVTFDVSEPLATAPAVLVDDVRRGAAEQTADANRWLFRFEATAADDEGPHTLRADLTDRVGNTAGASLGVVTFDFAAPELSGSVVLPEGPIGAGGVIVVELGLDEPLGAPPTLALADLPLADGAFDAAEPVADDRFRFSLAVSAAVTDGSHPVTVSATDLAGNVAVRTVGAIVVDQTAPLVLGTPRVVPSPAALGDAVTVSIDVNEAIAGSASLLASLEGPAPRSFALELLSSDDALLRFRHDVGTGEDGVWTLTLVDVVDLAGNVAPDAVVGAMMIDTTAPAIVDYEQDAVDLAGNLVVRFRVDEAVAAPPTVHVGALALTQQSGPDPYVFSAVVTPVDVGADAATPIVRAVDLAGNPGLLIGPPVIFDTTPPALANATFAPPIVGVGQLALLTVVVTEPLALDPLLAVEPPDTSVTLVQHAEDSLSWTYLVTADALDVALVSLELEDRAGNRATVNAPEGLVLTVDNAPPSMSSLVIEGNHFSTTPPFNEVVIRFTVDRADTPPHLISAGAGNEAMACEAVSTVDWVCSIALGAGTSEGFMPVYASVLDEAGNRTSAGSVVRVDLSPPVCFSTTASLKDADGASTTALPLGGVATIDVFCEEEVIAPVFDVRPLDLAFSATTPPGSTGDWWRLTSAALADGAHEGAHTPVVALTDVVGNTTSAPLVASGFLVDVTAPAAPVTSAIVVHEAPWGDQLSSGVLQQLVGAAGAAEGQSTLFAYESDDASASLASTNVSVTGAFSLSVGAPIRDALFVAAQDGAHNMSPRARVEQHRLTASARAPSVVRVQTSARLSAGSRTGPSLEADLASRVASGDGSVIARSINGRRWRELGAYRNRPGAGDGTSAAFHRAAGVGVVLGGTSYAAAAYLVRDGLVSLYTTTPFPTALAYTAMTYDSARGFVVAFGGRNAVGTLSGSTYLFDGSVFTVAAPTAGAAPSPRMKTALAFDRARGVVVMFGGQTGAVDTAVSADLWEWDGRAWTQRPASGTWPSARAGHAMAWDDVNQKVMLCGGLNAASVVLRDCYHLDDAGFTTAPSVPPFAGGTPQAGAQLIEIDDTGELWLTAIDSRHVRVARWDGAAWQAPDFGGPHRAYAGAYFDPEHHEILQLGGGRIFRYRNGGWLSEPASPPPFEIEIGRASSAAGYAIIPGQGPDNSYGPVESIDTSWTELAGADGGEPPQRWWAFGSAPDGHAFALQPDSDAAAFFARDDTGPAWWSRPSPPIRITYDVLGGRGPGGALFVTRDGTLLFDEAAYQGGSGSDAWTVWNAPGPVGFEAGHDTLFFDPRPGRGVPMLLHFQDTGPPSLWELDVNQPAWVLFGDIAPLPSAGMWSTTATVTPDGIYLVDFDADSDVARVWRLDESGTPMVFDELKADVDLPARTYRGSAVQDLASPTFVVATGGDAGAPGVVALESDLDARPVQLFELPTSITPGAIGGGSLIGIEVRTRARAGPPSAPGPYQVLVWCGTAYRSIGVVNAAPFAPATSTGVLDDTCRSGTDKTLTIAIAPVADVDTNGDVISVDLVEAVIDYHTKP